MHKKLGSLSLIVGLCIGLTGCGDAKPKEKVFLSETEVESMYTTPKDFKGKYVTLYGEVFSDPETDEDTILFQMWGDPANSSKNTLVSATSPEGGLKNGDYIKVVGYVDDEFKGTNAFGGEVSAPKIIAESIEKTDYVTAVSPTIKEVLPENASVEQFGITIQISKVEFAEAETRVYYKIINNSANKFNFYSFNTKLTQGGKQFEEQSNYSADYKSPDSETLPNITNEGLIAYPAIEQSNFTIIAEGRSNNYREDFNEFTFDITVE